MVMGAALLEESIAGSEQKSEGATLGNIGSLTKVAKTEVCRVTE